MPPARTVAMAREAARAPPKMRAMVRTPPAAMEAAMTAVIRAARVPVERRPPLKKRERENGLDGEGGENDGDGDDE